MAKKVNTTPNLYKPKRTKNPSTNTKTASEDSNKEPEKMSNKSKIALIIVVALLLITLIFTGTKYYKMSEIRNATTTEEDE